MRIAPLATLALVALTLPAFAETKLEDIGPNADRDFWCGAAFGVLVYTRGQAGDDPAATDATINSNAIFEGLKKVMQEKSLPKEDFDGFLASYTAAVMDPFARSDKSYSREECDAAAAEAVKANTPAAQ